MKPRYFVDLHGLTLAEAEAKTRKMLEDYQADALYCEAAMTDIGGDPADHAAIKRRRAEMAKNRERLIVKLREMVARK